MSNDKTDTVDDAEDQAVEQGKKKPARKATRKTTRKAPSRAKKVEQAAEPTGGVDLAVTTAIDGDHVLIIPVDPRQLGDTAKRLLDAAGSIGDIKTTTTPQRGLIAPVGVARAAKLIT